MPSPCLFCRIVAAEEVARVVWRDPDHVAFFEPTEGALFTGDTVVGRGTSFIDPPEGDLARYLRRRRDMLGSPR